MRVLLVFGGPSVEHTVSIISARSVAAAVDPARFRVVPCYRTSDEKWATVEESAAVLRTKIEAVADRGVPIPEHVLHLPAGTSEPEALARAGEVEVAFPLVHGTWGEDGTLQGYLESCNLPYVGAGVRASAVGMDKAAMKAIFRDANLPTARSEVIGLADPERNDASALEEKVRHLGLPLFVKPVNAGSSIGITKVKAWSELLAAVDLAFRFDEKILVEEGLDVREIECAVLGDLVADCAPPGEIIPGHEFYDYDDKYFDDRSASVIPAKIEPDVAEAARTLAIRIFHAIGCSGLARVDLFLERATGRLLANEINTLPGFTSISMYPKMWGAAGLAYPDLIARLVALAFERDARRRELAASARAFLEAGQGAG